MTRVDARYAEYEALPIITASNPPLLRICGDQNTMPATSTADASPQVNGRGPTWSPVRIWAMAIGCRRRYGLQKADGGGADGEQRNSEYRPPREAAEQ